MSGQGLENVLSECLLPLNVYFFACFIYLFILTQTFSHSLAVLVSSFCCLLCMCASATPQHCPYTWSVVTPIWGSTAPFQCWHLDKHAKGGTSDKACGLTHPLHLPLYVSRLFLSETHALSLPLSFFLSVSPLPFHLFPQVSLCSFLTCWPTKRSGRTARSASSLAARSTALTTTAEREWPHASL